MLESEDLLGGILTDDVATLTLWLMLDRLMIYGEQWDTQNGTQVNIHLLSPDLLSRGLPTARAVEVGDGTH